jgi:transcriptional regulator with XRE-family HTH domain
MPKHAQKARRLQGFIDSQSWNKAEFARRMGIAQQSVNRYLTGELDPMNLAEELFKEGCDIEWLMTGKESSSSQIGVTVISDKEGIHFSKRLPESTKKKIRDLVREVENLKDADVEKVRDLVRTIFGTKKG